MRGCELAEAMAAIVDCLVKLSGLDRAIKTIVDTVGRFNGKDVTSYLEAYTAEILMWDIPKDRRLSRFA